MVGGEQAGRIEKSLLPSGSSCPRGLSERRDAWAVHFLPQFRAHGALTLFLSPIQSDLMALSRCLARFCIMVLSPQVARSSGMVLSSGMAHYIGMALSAHTVRSLSLVLSR